MDQWSEGGGGFFTNDGGTSASKSKPAARSQFLYPATIRQVLEAPEEGIKFGENTTTMVTVIGIVVDVNTTSTNVTFSMTDDTGVIECIDWIETDDAGDAKKKESLMENNYYQVFGSIKSPQGKRRIMVFKVVPIEDFNLISAHMAEVLTVTRMVSKGVTNSDTISDVKPGLTHSNSYNPPVATAGAVKSKLNPQQLEILNVIQNTPNSAVGWNKNDPSILKKYNATQLEGILDMLVGEGLVYSTIDDEHYAST